MSGRIPIRASRANTHKEAVSGLDLQVESNLPQFAAIIFDQSPIDFGVVVIDTRASKEIGLKVNFTTFVHLKIKGDIGFRAELKKRPPELDLSDFDLPLLVHEYVPPLDIVSGPDDILFDTEEFQSVRETRPRLMSSKIETSHGERVAHHFNTPSLEPLRASMKTPPPAKRTLSDLGRTNVNEGGFDMVFGESQTQMGNVFPDETEPYYILVSFDAPSTIHKSHSATLTVSFNDVEVEIPLSARTGDIRVELNSQDVPAVMLGDSVLLPLRLINLGNMPAEVKFSAQTPHFATFVSTQSWTVPANQQVSVSLLVTTSITYFYNGLASLNLKWEGSYQNSSTGKRPLAAALMLSVKPPVVAISSFVSAQVGSTALVGVSITSQGPTTTLYFQAEGLPDGISMNLISVLLHAGQTTTTYLTLVVSNTAMVTETGEAALSFTVRYSAYSNLVQGAQSVELRVDNAFEMQAQLQSNWCWAATSVSVLDYYGGSVVQQCAMADQFTDTAAGVSCCDTTVPAVCNHPENTADALDFLGLLADNLSGALTLQEVIAQIDMNRPVVLRIAWAGGGAHAIAITGYVNTSAGDTLLVVEDPANGSSQTVIDINTLTTAYRSSGTWAATRLTQPPTP